jgi:hypothetical protein
MQRAETTKRQVNRNLSTVAPSDDAAGLTEASRASYQRIADQMFAVFCAGGQTEAAATLNSRKFAQESLQRSPAESGSALLRFLGDDSGSSGPKEGRHILAAKRATTE